MCEDCERTAWHSRRSVLIGGIAAGAALVAATWPAASPARVSASAAAVKAAPKSIYPGLSIHPRADWAAGRPPTGPLRPEPDVRSLLVHHTVTGNTYGDARAVIGSVYDFHTGADKRWPDIAYNFMVDRFGEVWECREGSLRGAVEGDATGGNQGFVQSVAFLGTHGSVVPSNAAQESMIRFLAWLADREGIVTSPGSTTSFVSRGSSRHPAGSTVVARTVSAHRDMSQTTCPGDAAYQKVLTDWPARATAYRSQVVGGGSGSMTVDRVSGGYRIRGSVVAASSPEATVSVFIDRTPVLSAAPTAQGRFDVTVPWPPGRAEVCVYRSDGAGRSLRVGCRRVSR